MNATTTSHASSTESPVPTSQQERFDLYGPIHKAMRAALSDLLVRMGKTTFSNELAAARIVKDLGALLVTCEEHIEHEARFIHPQLAARLPQALVKIDAGHEEHVRFMSELRSLMNGLSTAPTTMLRSLAGRTLHLHYVAFVADTLAHMVEEERALQPLVHRFFSDDELLGMQAAILASMSPAEQFASVMSMVPAVNGPERAGILGGVHAGAPPEAFQALVDALRPKLDAEEWAELVGLCPFLG